MDDLLSTITSNHPLKEDLKSELFLILCEMSDEKIIDAFNGNYINYLCVSIVKNQYHSSTSKFHKLFRKQKSVDYEFDIPDEVEWTWKEDLLNKIEKSVEKLKPVDRELFKMYFKMDKFDRELGELRDTECRKPISSLRKIEKRLLLNNPEGKRGVTIHHSTISLSIRRSLEKIKKMLDGDN